MNFVSLLTDAFGSNGGIALYNRDLLTALCNYENCDQVIAIPRHSSTFTEILPEKLIYETGGIDGKLKYIITVFFVLKKIEKIDLIICGHINLLPIAYLISIWKNSPLILQIYGIDAWKPTENKITNYLVHKIKKIISISETTSNNFLRWSKLDKKNIFLLPNAIHAEYYGMREKSQKLIEKYNLKNKKILMTVGRMSSKEQYKGFDQVLETLPDIIIKVPEIIYMVVGDGEDKERLAEKAQDLGVANNFIQTGFVDEDIKADYFRLADVYVMPSKGEGFGFVFLEAMACGVPVIASKIDGGRDAVCNGKLGLLVDPDDADNIKKSILQALKMPRKIPEGLNRFSFDNFSKRLYDIIESSLRRNNQAA